jgi:hypothetical protein
LGFTSHFDEAFRRAESEREEAAVFISRIIPEEDKDRIRHEIEIDANFAGREHHFFGMKVRNALRAGGFFYDPHVMDCIWFSWLKEAVCLPKDKIVITDSLRRRIRKYEEQQCLENPPICPEIEEEQTLSIIKQLEDRYRIRMPEVKIQQSVNVKNSLLISPPPYDLDELIHVKQERNRQLSWQKLTQNELNSIDSSKFTIFLARKHPLQGIGLYASAWHELAHVTARVIGIKDRVLNESFAYANEIRGLLQAAMKGEFSQEQAVDAVEFLVKCAKNESLDTGIFSALNRMGLKGIPDDMKTPYHYLALEAIKRHNPDLRFRNRNLNELVAESDRTIDHILATWRRTKLTDRLPAIILSCFVIALFLILIIVGLLH